MKKVFLGEIAPRLNTYAINGEFCRIFDALTSVQAFRHSKLGERHIIAAGAWRRQSKLWYFRYMSGRRRPCVSKSTTCDFHHASAFGIGRDASTCQHFAEKYSFLFILFIYWWFSSILRTRSGPQKNAQLNGVVTPETRRVCWEWTKKR